MFGSDSAPHPRDKKECCGCAAGVFTAPVALQILVELFAKHNALDALQAFTSDNARRIYGVNPPKKVVEFDNCGDVIPERYGDVIPIFAGQSTSYAITRVDTEL